MLCILVITLTEQLVALELSILNIPTMINIKRRRYVYACKLLMIRVPPHFGW